MYVRRINKFKKRSYLSQGPWFPPFNTRQRQAELCEFEASLEFKDNQGYTVRLCQRGVGGEGEAMAQLFFLFVFCFCFCFVLCFFFFFSFFRSWGPNPGPCGC